MFQGQRESVGLLRTAVREAEVLLNRLSGDAKVTFRDSGMLRIQARVLLSRASVIPGDQRADFIEDVGELEDASLGAAQKMRVLERMRWCYPVLSDR